MTFEPLENRQMLAIFTVTNLNDAPVVNPGDAPGTLRQAIFDANRLAGPDVIRFQAGLSGTVDLAVIGDATIGPSALLVNSPITIEGNLSGITIGRDPAAPDMRLFRVAPTGSLKLDSIMLTAGIARGEHGGAPGASGGEGRGGAVYSQGNLEIVACTFYDNHAAGGNASPGGDSGRGFGGAVHNAGGSASITNATFSANSASSGAGSTVPPSFGGAIYSFEGSLEIYNSTITNSTAAAGRGVYVTVGGGGSATVSIYSSIIAQEDAPPLAPDLVIASITGEDITVAGSNNLIRTQSVYHEITVSTEDPLLGPLTNNGGPTLTHAPSSASPAIDNGTNPQSLATDQRGPSYARVVGSQADIGAFELQTAVGPDLPGDYNENNVVDAADYVVWRKTLGATVPIFTGADGSGNGEIDPVDYSVWQQNFGDLGAGAAAFDASLPASSANELALMGLELPRPRVTLSGEGRGQAMVARSSTNQSMWNWEWLESLAVAQVLASETEQVSLHSRQGSATRCEPTAGPSDFNLDTIWSDWRSFFDFARPGV